MFHVKHFASNAELLGVKLDQDRLKKLEQFYIDVIEKNKYMNLTAITEEEEFHVKHYLDCFTAYSSIKEKGNGLKVADIGTGAGFPGIPLSIIMPENRFLLADSLDKRIRFLEEEKEKLGLTNVMLVHGRAEDLGHDAKYREKFDVVTARAVASLSTLSEYVIPFIHINGTAVAYKSADSKDEIETSRAALKKLGAKIEEIKELKIPGTDIERKLVIIKKIESTPKIYPRKAGTPSKSPLK